MNEFKLPSHNKRYSRSSVSRQFWMVLIVVGSILLLMYFMNKWGTEELVIKTTSLSYTPEANQGVIYHKPNFSLSYVEQYELPEWVAYELTVGMMNQPKTDRYQDFEPDPAIRSGSGHYHDYKQSGYRRGHLVPSADMAWNKTAMDATFLMSNVAPMRESFNDGIWLELEHNVRDWSRKFGKIQVVAGPLFKDSDTTIGNNEILVPRYFYKAVFMLVDSVPHAIGFLFDQQQDTFGPLEDYIVSIDSLEKENGIDLFANLYGDWDVEIALEKQKGMDIEWTFDQKWFNQRIEKGKK